MFRTRFAVTLVVLGSTLFTGHAAAVQRAHVATYGLDSNTSFSCDAAHPCRFFQAATTVVDPNGEVVVLDSGGYGAVTITKSLSAFGQGWAGVARDPFDRWQTDYGALGGVRFRW